MLFADVVLPVPLPGMFTYSLPDDLCQQVKAGCRVIVPFGNRKTTAALVARIHETPPEGFEVKSVVSIVDAEPVVLPWQLALWQWVADYYMCSLGEVYKAALPAPIKKGKKPVAAAYGAATKPDGGNTDAAPLHPSQSLATEAPAPLFALDPLSPAQQQAKAAILAAWQTKPVCLLHGVTSSGKTEIYVHLIAEAIARGEQVLYLLPEIVLTSQLTDRLRAVFGQRLGVYHSKFTDVQRTDVWRRQLSAAPYDVIVGVRSSVFLPFQRLGLVIVDEEHENSFKQQDPAPRYHARNVAIVLATTHHAAHAHGTAAKVLLGTATPSLESYYNARIGKYGLVALTERYGQVLLPQVEVIDTKELQRKRLMDGAFSPRLLDAMRDALLGGQQVILFQNSRGFARQVECHVCGWVPHCPHCDVALTLHKRVNRMTCHYCGFTTDIPSRCPNCEGDDLRQIGFGTERIEDDIHRLFPDARIARMDLDTTRSRAAYETIIHDFAEGRTDILVGTQMVTKGLDFERVSVVGILAADTMLNQPDFRAWEHAFQMMTQVAGRAGRRSRQGLVLLQTKSASLPLIAQVVDNDFDGMYTQQMLERRQFAFPPFVRLIMVYVKHRNATTIDILSRDAAMRLQQLFGTRAFGPDEPPVGRIQSLYIRRVVIKLELTLPLAKARELLHRVRDELLAQRQYASATIYFDVDPL